MQLKNLKEFIDFKNKCPFCHQELSLDLKSWWSDTENENVKTILVKEDSLFAQYTTSFNYEESRFQRSVFKSLFEIKIYLLENKVEYILLDSNNQSMRGKSFKGSILAIGFNATKFLFRKRCLNQNCLSLYSIETKILTCYPTYLYQNVNYFIMDEFNLERESFRVKNNHCVNDFNLDELLIYATDLVSLNLRAPFLDLTPEVIENIDNKIAMIKLFL